MTVETQPSPSKIGAVIERAGLGQAGDVRAVAPLGGGVSCDVFRVDLASGSICVKFALERLRVAADWRASPGRSAAEYAWLEFVGDHFPESAPTVLAHNAAHHAIVMAFLPPVDFPNWKQQLFSGVVDTALAERVGARLAAIHAISARQPAMPARFANASDFAALRIDPYLRATAARHPANRAKLIVLAESLSKTRITLAHGDVSPKNILCGPAGPVFIDAECATFGDPAFDVAFVLNHLLIKQILAIADCGALQRSALALWNAYAAQIDWEAPDDLEARAARLLPALMLARVDGKSPLEYLTDATAGRVRAVALGLLDRDAAKMAELVQLAAREHA